MSLQVNFTTHSHDLRDAYEAILRPSDPKSGDNWAIFGYDKGTNDLKVLGRGNGGLEELQDEFMDGKIQYAFTRIVEPYSQLNKFVLIAWCGDGVPESKKGLFNSHLADVAQFLKGYHLQINARNEADVTPAQIMKRAQEGSGSKYSTHTESYQHERIQPLQSAYKKTEIPDIAALQRNPTKPEPAPKYNIGGSKPLGTPAAFSASSASTSSPSTPSPATPSRLQDRVWPPPADASSTDSSNVVSPPTSSNTATAERSWKSSVGGGSYSAGSTTSSFNKVQPPSSLSSYGQSAPEPVVNKAHQMRLEREAREKEERERIKREIAASEARDHQSSTTSTAQRLAEERRLQEQREREREAERERSQVTPSSLASREVAASSSSSGNAGFNRVREERLAREKEERERAEAEDSARAAREAFKAREQDSVREQASAREEEEQRRQQAEQQRRDRENKEAAERQAKEADEHRAREEAEEEHRQRQQQEETRRRQEEEAEERRLNQQQQEQEDQQRQLEHEQEERRRQEEIEEHETQLQEEVNAATAQSVALGADTLLATADHPELATAGSVSAIVLYSYEKAEENEMALFEGEIIRNVTELDVGWWSGESEDGTRSGLFPANYVEVIEHAHEQESAPASAAAASRAVPAVASQEYEQEHEQDHDAYAHETAAHHADQYESQHGVEDASGQSSKPSAVALYDYQAGEPNEVSFAEGETIVEIDYVTEDWWSGKTEAGAIGLFPANYVEIIAP
ncbi:hypothetical protein EDD11_003044 [Mortierella claussenii]|nr:hypothetical protein EDD11_003044 [Mortierella claussenii]